MCIYIDETRTQKTALDPFWKENYFTQTISGNQKLGQASKMWLQGAEAVPVLQAQGPVGSAVFSCRVWPAQHSDAAGSAGLQG